MTEIEKEIAKRHRAWLAGLSVGAAVILQEVGVGVKRTVEPVPEPAPMPPASKKTRAPGAGRPPLNPPTERVWGRIPADLLPELDRRGGVAQVLIDALTRRGEVKA